MKKEISPMCERILSLLKVGRENATTTEELCLATGLHKRVLQKFIHEAREAGYLIISLSDVRGYYFPETKEDVLAFKNQMMSRAIDIFRAIKSAKQFLENSSFEGQQEIEG